MGGWGDGEMGNSGPPLGIRGSGEIGRWGDGGSVRSVRSVRSVGSRIITTNY
jgi:hypothetical protein